MKHLDYDKKLIRIIKGLREKNCLKHLNLAIPLAIDRSTYGRIENGELAFTPGQLKIMAQELKTSHIQILELADADCDIKHSDLSSAIIKAILISEGKGENVYFTSDELEFVISAIRERYLLK